MESAIAVTEAFRSFGSKQALRGISLNVAPREIRALLGPNGAGKTTLLRILTGLVFPTSGEVRVMGLDPTQADRRLRQVVGLVPSGDRSFYLRISGLENLVFFARLHGFKRRAALARAREVLDQVGLLEAAGMRVGTYSHGMQKRLSIARALLTDPTVLLIDEATHDLDPEGAERVRSLVRDRADGGKAVLWATQRLDEIRGFANTVTLLSRGTVVFDGTVPELLMRATTNRFILTLGPSAGAPATVSSLAERALAGRGSLQVIAGSEAVHYLLTLSDGIVLGDALATLASAGIEILGCQSERSEVEQAFMALIDSSHDE